VLVAGFPAGSFAANCYVVAPAAGEECVIIDPGQDAAPGVDDLVREHRLKPVAVILTHGHIDHVWSVAPVCGARNVPAFIHPGDRGLLSDPARGFDLSVGQQLFGGLTLTEPDDVRALSDGAVLRLAGLELTVDHAPGHTPGSVTFRAPLAGADERADADDRQVMFSGDLLFAGSIGRTDLPGGDHAAILASLARVCLTLPDETAVLPGHGPQTTIGRERAANPFLAELPPAPGLRANKGL
jgi:glyoxylase-like metal-dependent hydrolase (beta-lactamase superfamily II)